MMASVAGNTRRIRRVWRVHLCCGRRSGWLRPPRNSIARLRVVKLPSGKRVTLDLGGDRPARHGRGLVAAAHRARFDDARQRRRDPESAIRISRRSSIRCAAGGMVAPAAPPAAGASYDLGFLAQNRRSFARAGRPAPIACSSFFGLICITIGGADPSSAQAANDARWSRKWSRPGSMRCRSSGCCRS